MTKVLHLRCSGSLLGAESVILQLCSVRSDALRSVIGVIQDSRDPYPLLATVAASQGLPVVVFQASKLLDLDCIAAIADYVRNNSIDIIHTHGYREDMYSLLARTGVPLVATNHLWKRTNFTLRLYALLDSVLLGFFDRIVAVSTPILDDMRKYPYLRYKDMRYIPNGIDVAAFNAPKNKRFTKKLSISPSTVVLLTVSSLTIEKGHYYLLNALADNALKCLDWVLLIVGDGPEKSRLEQLANELGISDKVLFLGRRENIPEILSSSDVFVMPSLREGLPMALLEAMAAGLPCIASNVGEIPSIITHVRPDLLVSPKDVAGLTNKISWLLGDASSREELGRKSKKVVAERFSASAMMENYFKLYQELV
jgi:glycosyltransferase involved in cell wall biosynthesis